MAKPINLGFVGCGKHALMSHAEVVVDMPEMFNIKVAYDKDTAAPEKILTIDPNCRIARSSSELFADSRVDAVIIATPPDSHVGFCEDALMAKKHIFCEKPLWTNSNNSVDGVAVIAEALESGLIFTSCHPRRFDPLYSYAKDSLGELTSVYGDLEEFNFRFFYHKPTVIKSKSLLLDHMNHEIDLLNFILGRAPIHLRLVNDGFDHYKVTGQRNNQLSISFSGYRKLNKSLYWNELELVFSRGRAIFKSVLDSGFLIPILKVEDFDFSNLKKRKPHDFSSDAKEYVKSFYAIMENFGKAILGQQENYLSMQDLITNTLACTTLLEYGKCTI